MKYPHIFALLALTPCIPGCGGQSEDTAPDGSGGSAAGGTGGTVAQTGGTSGTSGSAAGGSGAGSGGSATSGGSGGGVATGGTGGGTATRSCQEIQADYVAAYEAALICEPAMSSLQCTEMVMVGLECACPEALNARLPEPIAEMQALANEYAETYCPQDVLCGPCMPPQGGGCSFQGVCVTYGPD